MRLLGLRPRKEKASDLPLNSLVLQANSCVSLGPEDHIVPVSDTDPARSPSPSVQRNASIDQPAAIGSAAITTAENGLPHNRYPTIASKPDGSNHQRLVLKTRADATADLSSPLTYTPGHPAPRRSRQETSYQRAVNHNRRQHVDHILHRQLRSYQKQMRRDKKETRSSFGMMIMNRLKDLPDMYDTDDEHHAWGPGGLLPNLQAEDDFGGESLRCKKVVDRAIRRLSRSGGGKAAASLVKNYQTNGQKYGKGANPRGTRTTNVRKPASAPRGNIRSRSERKKEEHLDDLDLELLGDKEDEQDEDSVLDESDGDDGDLTEEDMGIRA